MLKRIITAGCAAIVLTAVPAAAEPIPRYSLSKYCERMSGGGNDRMAKARCMSKEHQAYSALRKGWERLDPKAQEYCLDIGDASVGSYSLLATCMRQELGS